jgi:serine/threonine-protein kinase
VPELLALQEALGERYRLGGELGRGGMATVYRARDEKLQRDVAVKVLAPDIAVMVGVERFAREIDIAAGLQHPGIVPLFDSGHSGNVFFYIMPLVTGESLRDRLGREAQLPVDEALAIVRDVADALSYAHSRGIVHRDIKPENILLSGDRAMVADFGIARPVSAADGRRLTERGIAVGTPAYMSPEQAGGGDQIDGRADTYALGCVLYEMLAGEPPFTGRTAQAILARQLQERPPSLQVVRPTVSLALQEVVERALAKVPADRFPSATQFAAAAVSAVRSGSASGGQAVAAPRTIRSRSAVLGALLVAAAGAAAWMVTHRLPPADPNRVVVYPLSSPGPGVASGTGEQVALMLGSALEHTAPLTWKDGQGLLGAGADARIAAAVARRAARRAGARYYLDGAVVRSGDSMTVIIRLHDAVADSLVQESASGSVESTTAPQLALRAVARILPLLLPPNGRVDLSYLEGRDAAAIADWLQGEREYAHSQYVAAMDHMTRALGRDSAMGVAALKGAQAAAHLEDYAAARRLVEIALHLDRQLPPHHLALARGLLFYVDGAADSALAAFDAARALDTTWSEPWMWRGETYYHLMPSVPDLDSLAERAFAGAVRIDARFAPALFHLAEFAARRGSAARARELLASFRSVSPDSDWTFQLELTVRCAAEGPDRIDWPAAVRRASDRVVTVARILGAGARYPSCSRRALESVLAFDTISSADHVTFRWSALKGLDYQTIAEGRPRRAAALLDSALANGMPSAAGLDVLNVIAGATTLESRGVATIASLAKPFNQMRTVRLWYFAMWEFYRGDAARLDSVVQALRVFTDSTGAGADRLVAAGAAARLAVLRGDTAAAIRLLEQLRPASALGDLTWDLWEAAAVERLLLAQLLLATGDFAKAIEVAELFDSPRSQIHLLYLPASLQIRLRAAAGLGQSARRDRYRDRLLALGRRDLL